MADILGGGKINSPDYWNKRFFDDWITNGGRQQTAFFARLCCRELPDWFVEEVRARKPAIFDYGCALGDALPVLQAVFPASPIRGGDVAQVGLGLARALHPAFEFVDVNTIGAAAKLADIVYCSNTLEHFENWREILDRLSRRAGEFVIVVVPFEEEDRLDEHAATFEFDSLPPLLSSGVRLLHLGMCDAALEPETQWNGLQLIAIYGKKRRAVDRGSTGPISQLRNEALILDLRGVEPPSIPSLLAGLAALSRDRRRIAQNLKLAQAQAATGAAALEVLGEYAELTRGFEAAQRWMLDELTAVDPELIGGRQILPVPENWREDLADDVAAHRVALARLVEAVNRANRLGLAFHAQAKRARQSHPAGSGSSASDGTGDRRTRPGPRPSARPGGNRGAGPGPLGGRPRRDRPGAAARQYCSAGVQPGLSGRRGDCRGAFPDLPELGAYRSRRRLDR